MAIFRSWRAFVASTSVFIVLVAGSAAGLWSTGNQMYSDWLFNMGAVSLNQEPEVLLVERTDEASDPGTLANLVAELSRLGARRTVVLPGQFAETTEALPSDISSDVLVVKTPITNMSLSGGVGWNAQPSFEAGYFRSVPVRLEGSDSAGSEARVPWFVALRGDEEAYSSPLYLNFGFLKNGLPVVRQHQVLEGEVIQEVVRDRVVLLGAPEQALSPGYPVPGSSSPLSQLEMQGLIWSTVAGDVGLTSLEPIWQVLAILLLFVMNLFVFQWLSPIFGSIVSLALIIVFGGAGWLSLQYFHMVLPVVDLTIVQLASLLFVYQARRASEDRTVTEMLGTTNAALFERYIPEAFNEAASPWPKLVVFINQQLELGRSILLERVPSDHRVREIQAINCSIDDIAEKRRDYERTPYSDALQHRRPLQLKRAYFESSKEHELEYLVPLIFAGEVLGFWALTVTPEEGWSREAFESNIGSFAIQISELLYHRQQLTREKRLESRLGRRILALEAGRNKPEQLRSALELLGNRLATLEAMFDSLKAGAIMYDLFGQVLQANARALDIAGQANLAVYKMTALDFLCGLCHLNQETARRQLRHVTLKRAELRLPVRAVAGNQALMVSIRPIGLVRNKLEAPRVANSAQPFKILGLSFEITDVSHAGAALRLREDLLQQLLPKQRNQLSRLSLVARLTSAKIKAIPAGERLLSELDQTVTAIEGTIAEVEDRLDGDQASQNVNAMVPVNVLRVVGDALSRSEKRIKEKHLTVSSDWPFMTSLVSADAEELSELIDRVVVLLCKDATPGSQLQIDIREQVQPEPRVSVEFSNVGYGIPQSALDRILAKAAVVLLNSDDPLEETLGMVKSIEHWGGQAEVSADVGKGFCLRLHFRPLALDSAASMPSAQGQPEDENAGE